MSHEHEVPSLLLSPVPYCFQVAPRTCVRCPSASLRKGVTLRGLPIPPALVRASPRQQPFSRRFEKYVCATVGACGSEGCQFRRRYSMLAVCPQYCLSISFIGVWVVAHTSPPSSPLSKGLHRPVRFCARESLTVSCLSTGATLCSWYPPWLERCHLHTRYHPMSTPRVFSPFSKDLSRDRMTLIIQASSCLHAYKYNVHPWQFFDFVVKVCIRLTSTSLPTRTSLIWIFPDSRLDCILAELLVPGG